MFVLIRNVLIESDWNLKKFYYLVCPVEYDRINRIRLEFKVDVTSDNARMIVVLIESDWNLKFIPQLANLKLVTVLIESDWNLKLKQIRYGPPLSTVLIESDWNLKYISLTEFF